jgi:CDP-glucose 4,6-dehydratase
MNIIICDLRDFRGLFETIAGEDIDTVFHVGASAIVGTAARTPLDTWETNVMGTANILEACRLTRRVKRIVVASSDKAYGDHREHLPYQECYALRGLQIYECSKSCTDLIAQTYFHQFHLPLRVTRCCNIYGPGDLNFSRLVPGAIARLLEPNEKPVIRPGQGDVKREYLHVDDAVDAYLQIARSIREFDEGDQHGGEEMRHEGKERQGFRCAYNIGAGDRNVKTVREMMQIITELMQRPCEWEELCRTPSGYGELPHQYLDSTKIAKELGWAPKRELRQGLLETVRWYTNNKDRLRPLYLPEIRAR